MASLLPKQLDRATLRMITVKRFVTGTASVIFSIAMLVYGLLRFDQLNGSSRIYWVLGVLIFGAGGSWSLRDAVRGQRLLRG